MKAFLLLTACFLMISHSEAQRNYQQKAPKGLKIYPRVTDLHLHNPTLASLPANGPVTGMVSTRLLFETTVRKKKLHGSFISFYENGAKCDSGKFVQGLPDGEWKFWNADGSLKAIRTYNADRYRRITQEMAFASPKATVSPLARLYRSNPSRALHYLHADYSFPHERDRQFKSLEDLVLHNTTAGAVYHPVFKRSLQHGLYLNYNKSGLTLDSGYYQNGLREGLWIHSEGNQGREEGRYVKGRRSKDWKQYDTHGRLIRLMVYDEQGQISWQKNYQR